MSATTATPRKADLPTLTRDEQLLKYFVQACPQRLGRTQLVKLVYLADIEARRYTGAPLSTFTWKREPQGPFDSERFYAARASIIQKGELREIEDVTPRGHPWYQYLDAGGQLQADFSAAEQRILAYIVAAYGGKSREEILGDVYDTAPFKAVEDSPRGTPLPMDSVNNERTTQLGGLSLASIIQGERSLRAGDGLPITQVISLLRGAVRSDAA